jgi:HEAT repeat protein
MKSENQIFSLLESGEIEEFLYQASELDISVWNNIDVLKSLIKSLRIPNLGLRDYIYRVVLNVSEHYKAIAANLLIDYLYQTDKEIRNLASDLLIKLGEYSNNSLLQLLSDDDIDVRKFASDILGYTGTDNEISDLVLLLKDTDMNVFTSAIESIGSIFDRHKEKIGLADSMLDLLISIYSADNSDTKPVIIEAISKIGNYRATEFLIERLNIEEDIFIETAIIDALSICGDSIYLCQKLYDEIGNYQPELQPIVLKTLVAVALRIGFEIADKPEIRMIARRSLTDTDPDIRTAGLIALGDNYYDEEIIYLVNEYIESSDEIKYYILSKLLTNTNIYLFENFFKEFISNSESPDHNYTVMEMVGLIHNLSAEIDDSGLFSIFKTIVSNNIESIIFEKFDIFDSLNQLNNRILIEVVRELINRNDSRSEYLRLMEYLENNTEIQ